MSKSDSFISLDFTRLEEDTMVETSRAFFRRMNQRRTVREFSDQPIPQEVLENAIKAAGTAPSGAHMQPWHFAVVQDPDTKRKIREAAEVEERKLYDHRASEEWLDALAPFGTDANKPFLETAPALIVLFSKKFTIDESGEKRKNYYTSESVGIACGILITALHSAGLATLTHTPSPMKFLCDILERPSSERPFILLVCGYPADNAEVPNLERLSLDDIASFN